MTELAITHINLAARALVILAGAQAFGAAARAMSVTQKAGLDAVCMAMIMALQFPQAERAAAVARCT